LKKCFYFNRGAYSSVIIHQPAHPFLVSHIFIDSQ
jgi:hypothetical protein